VNPLLATPLSPFPEEGCGVPKQTVPPASSQQRFSERVFEAALSGLDI